MRKMKASMLVVVACVSIMGYLYITSALSQSAFFFLFAVIIMALLFSQWERRVITLEEAKDIARRNILDQQRIGEVPFGKIWIEEAELKDIVLLSPKKPEVVPDKFYIKVYIEPGNAYLVKISLYGSITATSRIRVPGAFSVNDIPERKYNAGQVRLENVSTHDDNEAQQGSNNG